MATKIALSELFSHLPDKIDLFLCSASFEERSKSIPSVLAGRDLGRVLIFSDHQVSGSLGIAMTERLNALFPMTSTYVPLNLRDPLDIADKLIRYIGADDCEKVILIDVTTFTHETLLIILRVLQLLKSGKSVFGLYNGASEYAAGQPVNEKWLTKGVSEIRSVLGYPGEGRPTQSQHLIILAGFETERAERIIEAYEPALLSIGVGDQLESISANHYDVNTWFHRRLMERYTPVRSFTFSCDDVLHTRDAVLAEVHATPQFNVVIAPLNTKISTLGAGLAALIEPNIQMCYAIPEQYNRDNYSTPSDSAYFFAIPI